MILEGIISGIVSNVIGGILKDSIARRIFKALDDREIEQRIESYLAHHPGTVHPSEPLASLVNRQLREILSRLGPPTSSELPAARSPLGTTGRGQRFAGQGDGANLWDEPNRIPIGVSIYSSRHGTYPTWGEIGRSYERLGGTTSRLGFPTSVECNATPSERGTTGQVQRFEGGRDDHDRVSVYCSPRGAYSVWGEIGQCYEHLGGTGSRLGFPTSPEGKATRSPQGTSGWFQRFEGGKDDHDGVSIYCSHYGGYPIWGEMARRYEALGGTTSYLGFPISSEQGVSGWVQHFEGGDLSV